MDTRSKETEALIKEAQIQEIMLEEDCHELVAELIWAKKYEPENEQLIEYRREQMIGEIMNIVEAINKKN